MRRRFDVLHEIERLDPERDHQRIVHLSRREPHFFTDSQDQTYPRGDQISELGPPRLVAAEGRRAQAHQEM